MDSIYAIAFGLGLRTLVDAVSHNLKLTGSLIGLWEGVITLHFLKKMPKSSDPYIAYGVRLFIDFLITESIERLVLVLIWTAFGIVLADVTPAIWDEVGLRRVWRHFRRDLYTIYDKIPTVAFFPPQRTVRFLPPRQRHREPEPRPEPDPSIVSPSIATSHDTPITVIPPSSSFVPSEPLRHRVPGYYPEDFTDTDTDFGSMSRSRVSPRTEVNNALGTTHYRLSTIPKLNRTYSVSDLDEGNQSSVVSSPSSEQDDIPDIEEEEQALVDNGIEEQEQALVDNGIKEQAHSDPTTPKPHSYIPMPPTPSDSAARWDIHRDVVEDILHAKPLRQDLPNIPDSGEDVASDGWEKIHRRELDENIPATPPTPPAKDRPVGSGPISSEIPPFPPTIPPVPLTTSNSFNDIDYSLLDSISHLPSTVTENRRESGPPPYTSHQDDFEDIYYNPPAKSLSDAHVNVDVNENVNNDNNDFNQPSSRQAGHSDVNTDASANPWASYATAQAQTDAAAEAAERVRKEEVEERIRKEEEQKRQEAEEALKKKEAEKRKAAEMKKKEEDDDVLRKQRQAVEKKREEEAAKREEEKKRQAIKEAEEAAAAQRVEEKRIAAEKEAEAATKREEEKKRKAAEREEEKRKAAEATEAAAAKRKEEEEAAAKRQAEVEGTERKKREDAAKKEEEIAEQKRKDDAVQRKKETEGQEARDTAEEQEAAKHAQKETEEAKLKLKSEPKELAETETQQVEQAELNKQNADAPGDQTTQEKDDDSKTLHGVEIPEAQQRPSETDNVQDPAPRDSTEEESVISTFTAHPSQEAKVRLERMMILRAQMVELENRLNELKGKGLDENSPEVQAIEKSLRKHQRQADRRYTAGVLFFQLSGLSWLTSSEQVLSSEISMTLLMAFVLKQ